MKRLLCMLLILAMTLTGALALCSCDKGEDAKETDEKKTEAPKTVVIPEGYTKFDNGDLSFAYPSDWKKTEGSLTQLINSTGAGNNITVVYEAKTDLYEKSSEAELKNLFSQSMSAVGMSISNFKLSQTKNDFTDKITKMTCTTSIGASSMKQTMLVVTVGERTYTITITEANADQALVDNVFNTLVVLK